MSKSSERVPVSKRQRFNIFARDGFTCRYCGKQPPHVTLVIDHVIPVSKGGTNDDGNLATSCNECNQGKSNIPLPDDSMSDMDSLRLAQNRLEKVTAAKLAIKACRAQEKLRDKIYDHVVELTGHDTWKRKNLSYLLNLFDEFGADKVAHWMSTSFVKTTKYTFNEDQFCRYLGGIARQVREREEALR